MKKRMITSLVMLSLVLMIVGGAVLAAKEAPAAKDGKLAELKIELPKPLFEGTPKNIKVKMRAPIKNRKIKIAAGTKLLSAKKAIASSDEEPIIGELDYVTDGDKEGTDGSFVELGPGLQWVQIDLGAVKEIHAVVSWHYHREGRVYKDVIVKVSNDKDCITGTIIFNNDHDNSAGQGIGKDFQYLDDFKGEVTGGLKLDQKTGIYTPDKVVKGRYVRLYSNGNTSNDLNHYTEVEVYGK